jgi:predicted nucleic acid-binding protein
VIVVSDTSPLNYLVLINVVDVLPQLFGEVHVPLTVIQELQHPRAPESVKQWANSPPPWLRISTPRSVVMTSIRLDLGESQAIALAKELNADAVLIDERKGRQVAAEHGIDAVGTVAVLEFASSKTY